MKDSFDKFFHPGSLSKLFAELSIKQDAFEKVGHKEIELKPTDEIGNTAFHIAASKDFIQVFDIIQNVKGDKNPPNKDGCTPIHIAAEKGNLEIFKVNINVLFCQAKYFI